MTPLTTALLADIDRLIVMQGPEDDEGDSFWQETGRNHRDMVARYGFETFKRHLNWQYGSWPITKFHSRFTLRCLFALLRRGALPALAETDLTAGPHYWPRRDNNSEAHRLRAYGFYVGSLWRYAELDDRIGALRLAEPSLGCPMPVYLRGRQISQDLAMASLDLNAMGRIIDLSKARHVLEIGAGYGRLAYVFASLFPDVQYTIADIAPALAVAQNYLPRVTAAKNFRFVLPHELDAIANESFDVVINVSSLDEMPAAVQQRYMARIDRLCRGHLYLSGHYYRANGRGLDQLKFPDAWTLRLNRYHDVFQHWTEKIFAIGR